VALAVEQDLATELADDPRRCGCGIGESREVARVFEQPGGEDESDTVCSQTIPSHVGPGDRETAGDSHQELGVTLKGGLDPSPSGVNVGVDLGEGRGAIQEGAHVLGEDRHGEWLQGRPLLGEGCSETPP